MQSTFSIIKNLSKTFIFTALAFLLMTANTSAQTDQARIAGTITDTAGAVVPGVTVTAKNEKTGEERTVVAATTARF